MNETIKAGDWMICIKEHPLRKINGLSCVPQGGLVKVKQPLGENGNQRNGFIGIWFEEIYLFYSSYFAPIIIEQKEELETQGVKPIVRIIDNSTNANKKKRMVKMSIDIYVDTDGSA